MPLETLTITGLSERSSSGRNACVTRTTPEHVGGEHARRRPRRVVSGTGDAPAEMPALLISTSSSPDRRVGARRRRSRRRSRRAATKRAPSSSAAARPRSGSRAPIQTSWPCASRRRAASCPRPLLAPVMSVLVMRSMVARDAPATRDRRPGTRRATLAARVRHHEHGSDELADCLRTWRDRLTPGRGGPAGGQPAPRARAAPRGGRASSPASRSTTSRGSSRAARPTRRRRCWRRSPARCG